MHILVMEDDDRIAGFIKRGLEAEDYKVDVALTKHEGLDLITQQTYAIMILDLFLGADNGLEICRELRSQQNTTPILLITAKDSPDMKQQSLHAGANGYLPKPFSFEEFLENIRRLSNACLASVPFFMGIGYFL